ncbi:MAG: hypothetical protein AAF960_29460 [Bacteroidota bacterium]
MKKTPRWLSTVCLCFLAAFSSAQISLSNYNTYSLEVTPFRTQYGNILTEKDVNLSFKNLTRVEENGDLYIRVDFVDGLKSNYLLQTAIPGTGFAYRVEYRMPTYRVSILDRNGNLILQKMYGGEKRKTLFGEFESISSIEDLKFEWEANRDAFYAKLESKPEEIPTQPMDQELTAAVLAKSQEMATGTTSPPVADNPPVTPEEPETTPTETRKKPNSRPSKANVNIYRRPEKRKMADDPATPKLSPTSEQIYDLNGFIEVDACSKYSYQIKNIHPLASMTVLLQDDPTNEPEEILLSPNEEKFFSGVPDKSAWLVATYQRGDFQEDQINVKEDLNLIATDENQPRIVTTLLDQFFEEVKPQINVVPQYDNETDEMIGYQPENNVWKKQLRDFLAKQTVSTLTKGEQNKIANETEKLLTIRAIRAISEQIEPKVDDESKQKLIYPIVKASKNFRNTTPFLAVELSRSAFLTEGINEYWNQQTAYRASMSFRLPFEWPLGKRKTGAFSTLNIKASYEVLTLDFNQTDFRAFAIDPENAFMEPEQVFPEEQFALQATQLSAGLAWKFYFPLPIFEIEAGAFYSNQTRLLWGEDQGQFPRSLFNPENAIISNVVDLSSFRPYFGAKVGLPFYFSGYKFDCDSNLKNAHVFAGFRMYPVDFSKNDNYNVFIRDATDIDFIPIPLEDGQSTFLMHLMLGLAVEF